MKRRATLGRGKGSLCTVNNADAYSAACLAGLGIIQVPAVGVQNHLKSGLLVEILTEHAAPPMPLTLLYAKDRKSVV